APADGQFVMEMLPDPSLTVITCGDAELVGTVTRRPPESVTALTRYGVVPGGRTSVTVPEPLSTCTRAGTLATGSVRAPDRALPSACGAVRAWLEMLPEPVLTVTLAPDTVAPEMSPDPVCMLTASGMFSAWMLPEPVVALTGPDRSVSVTLPEPAEMSVRLPA